MFFSMSDAPLHPVKTSFTIIHINVGFKKTSLGCFVGTHPGLVELILVAGHILHIVQAHRSSKHVPEEVNDTVCPNEPLQDVQRGEDA